MEWSFKGLTRLFLVSIIFFHSFSFTLDKIITLQDAAKNLVTLCNSKDGYAKLDSFISTNPEQAIPLFLKVVENHKDKLFNTRHGADFLDMLIQTKQCLYILNLCKNASPSLLNLMNIYPKGNFIFKNNIEQLVNKKTITEQIFILSVCNSLYHSHYYDQIYQSDEHTAKQLQNDRQQFIKQLSHYIPNIPDPTQTERHLLKHSVKIITSAHYQNWIYYSYVKDSTLLNLAQQIIDKEKTLKENYYTFVHGQQWHLNFIQRIFTQLWEIKNNSKLDDFFFIHAKKLDYSTENLKEEETTRQKLLHADKCRWQDPYLLFMNYAFFANYNNSGSNSAYYLAKNSNAASWDTTTKELFALHGYENIYEQFAQELEELREEHKKLSSHGQCLLIAVPKAQISSCIQAKHKAAFNSLKDSIWISDISTIMKTLTTNPQDIFNDNELEFCLIMTQDTLGGMNPASGIKTFAFNSVEPELWQNYCAKEQALMAKIGAVIQQQPKVAQTLL